MQLAIRKRSGKAQRGVTWFTLVLLVAVQVLASAHFHSPAGSQAAIQSSASAADLCPICLYNFHAPTTSSARPVCAGPLASVETQVLAAAVIPPAHFEFPLFGRAPPVII